MPRAHRSALVRRSSTRRVPRVGAFFDMDKTLIAENSATLYMKAQWERGEVTGWEVARGAAAYLQYKLGILDIQAWTREMVKELAGRDVEALKGEARELVESRVIPAVYPEAARLVREHQERGHVVAIVSGATEFVVGPLAEHLAIEHFLYTRLEIEEGRLTGRAIEPVCFEEGKIYWLEQFIDEHGIDLAKSWFYTDSVTDLPLLELVGHPVVANPDPMLYRTAVRRHWPVRFFTPPAGGDVGTEVAEGTSATSAPTSPKNSTIRRARSDQL